jgi:hypothetical protein
VLLSAGLIGAVAIMPYALELSGDRLKEMPLPLPLPVVLVLQFAQNAIFVGAAVAIGLLISRKVGLGAPVLEVWLYERRNLLTARMVAASAIAGAAIGALIALLAYFVFLPLIPQLPFAAEGAIPLWKRLLSCFYGALNEEILMRLFLLSLVLWLTGKLWRSGQGKLSIGAFWTTNILVALLFGLGHMPAVAQIMPINLMTLLYVLSLNGIASVLFGYLFWKRGLESAIIAHFFTDLAMTIAPAFAR